MTLLGWLGRLFNPGFNRRDFPIFARCRHSPTFFDVDTIEKGDAFDSCRQFIMTSLKRSYAADSTAPNLSSKVYIRSTKSGKVQKIVREVYLRQDIPCSSRLCQACLKNAPRHASGTGQPPRLYILPSSSSPSDRTALTITQEVPFVLSENPDVIGLDVHSTKLVI